MCDSKSQDMGSIPVVPANSLTNTYILCVMMIDLCKINYYFLLKKEDDYTAQLCISVSPSIIGCGYVGYLSYGYSPLQIRKIYDRIEKPQ